MCEKQSCDPIGNCVETFKSLVVNDNIHGNLEVPRICKAIIDTLEFGRLKYINQLGTSYLVYPGATHNRWEHSVGVMKIAGQFVHHLMGKYPGCCTEKDRLAVMLAGLCHDLGHGPFSHLWEFFVHKARPGCGWTHEQASLKMFDYLIEKNNLMPLFEEEGFDANDILFIKEMMYGPLPENGGEYVARGLEKYFLYEIVANKTTSIDVDKWDYFKRDSQALDVNIIFDYERYILMSYLQWDENKRRRLALAEKEASSVVNLFKDRANLHAMGYQHRVVKVFDQMVVDMLCLADKHIHLCYDEQDKPVPLSEACDNMYAYSQLTDNHLLMSIQNSRSQELSEARDICRRIACRDQYKCIGSICIDEGQTSIAKKLDDIDIEKSWIEFVSANSKTLSPSDLPLTLKRITYGCSSNPMERVFLVNSKGEKVSPDKKHIKELENVCDEELFFLLRSSGHQAHLEGIQLFTTWNPKLEDKLFDFGIMSTEKVLLESVESPGKDLDVTVNVSFGSDSSCSSPNLDRSTNNEIGSPTPKDVERLKRGSSKSLKKKTLINDSVHGHIEVPEICMRIIDTNQFRRLSSIKQLGTSFYVYPCSKHTRWEHSLGVMHLAEKFIDELLKDYPGCCTRKDKICVMIGGLCHDLGHGPFSHLFESFMLEARPGCGYKHEQTSLDMFRFLLEENNLRPVFKELEDLDEIDITFIEELIYGPLERNNGQLVGRVEKEKQFLYQIVANKSTSIDVDKWDYYRRDNQAMNLGLTFDQGRFMLMSRLGIYKEETILAYESKSFDDVVKMFEDRARLHKNGYQHRVVKITDRMLLDLLLAADKHIIGILQKDRKGPIVPLSEAPNDMKLFSKLTDEYVFQTISNSESEEESMVKAREICQRLNQRNLYKYLGCFYQKGKDLRPKLQNLQKTLREKIASEGKLLKPDDIVLCMKKVDCGDGNNNPVMKVPFVMDGRIQFYDSKYVTESMSSIYYQEILFVLRPHGDEVLREAKQLFKAWATSNDIEGVRVEFK